MMFPVGIYMAGVQGLDRFKDEFFIGFFYGGEFANDLGISKHYKYLFCLLLSSGKYGLRFVMLNKRVSFSRLPQLPRL